MGLLGKWREWAEIESIAETASRIGVTDQTIRNWAKERPDLLVERDGHMAVRRDEVQALIRSNRRLMKLCGPSLAREAELAKQSRNPVAAVETKPRQPVWKTVHFAAPTALVDDFWSVVKARGGSAIKTLEAALAALRDAESAERDEARRRAAKARFDARVARRMEPPCSDDEDAKLLPLEEVVERRKARQFRYDRPKDTRHD
ncbi:MAG: hypothetical protein K2X00_12205 [Nitrospiraceae bacterium]|nr:hypothetical protein [Nitrospiraceae bacterium]